MTVGKVDLMSPYTLDALMNNMNDSNTPKGTPEDAEDLAELALSDNARRAEVIRGSNLDAFPDFNGNEATPIRVLPQSKSSTALNDSLQHSEFESVYQELLVCMEFTDEELLHYTPAERMELRLNIDLFLANRGQDYEELAGEIENRALFKDFFPAD
jgi:hypothetical protein